MVRPLRRSCLLVGAVSAATLVCFAMHYQGLRASIHASVQEQAWKDLERSGQVWAERLFARAARPSPGADALAETLEAMLGAQDPPDERLLLMSARGKVVWLQGSPPGLRLGAQLQLPTVAEAMASYGSTRRCMFAVDENRHLAARFALGDGRVQLAVYESAETVQARADAITSALGPIEVITCLWALVMINFAIAGLTGRRPREQKPDDSFAHRLRQTKDLLRTRDAVIFGLAKLAESRDPDTGEHLERISAYSTALAAAASRHPDYAAEASTQFVRLIGLSAVLHDIGKVGLEDDILRSTRPLTREQRSRMEQHTTIAATCLKQIDQRLGGSHFLTMAREIALSHHEHWDGTGYPQGLAGSSIPLSARIVAIADVYDALSSPRSYKGALDHATCIRMITRGSGSQFDPGLISVLWELGPRFLEIQTRFRSAEPQPNEETEFARLQGPPEAGRAAPQGSPPTEVQETCQESTTDTPGRHPTHRRS